MKRHLRSIGIVFGYILIITLVITACFSLVNYMTHKRVVSNTGEQHTDGGHGGQSSNGVLNLVITVSGILIAGLASVFFAPISRWVLPALDDILFGGLFTKDCRVLVFGKTRTGKSSFLKRSFSLMKTKDTKPTEGFILYKFKTPYTIGQEEKDLNPKYINIMLADYQGEHPSDVIVDYNKSFFGPRGDRKINILIFMVDLLKEYRENDDDTMPKIKDEIKVEKIKTKVFSVVEERVRENTKYINRNVLTCLGKLAVGENKRRICGVGLFINKIDFLELFYKRGYITKEFLSENKYKNLDEYAKDLYNPLFEELKDLCVDLKLDILPKISVISAEQGVGYEDFIDLSFESYMAKKDRGEL